MGFIMIGLLFASIVMIVAAGSLLKLHPFISLLAASLFLGLSASALGQFDVQAIEPAIRHGFGTILSHIGIVIVLGSVIGVFLEKSGAALKMADSVVNVLGPKRPELAMSIIGWLVSIPVFCDSGYIILNAMRKSVTRRTRSRSAAMSVALSSGLYASHTLIPPTPGPVAAAGNLGLENHLGTVVLFGIGISIFPLVAGALWASYIGEKVETKEDRINTELFRNGLTGEAGPEGFPGKLPSTALSFAPIIVPIFLIGLGSFASIPEAASTVGIVGDVILFLGNPTMALLIGFIFALFLAPELNEEALMKWIGEGIRIAGPIILITGAGGAFGAIIKATPISDYLGRFMSAWSLGILLPFIFSAALKTAQGSTTTTMVTASALMAPLLTTLGLDSVMGTVLVVMSIGAGAMTVSHANDSYFWVVAEFSGMDIKTAYKSHTAVTGIQGLVTMAAVLVLSALLL